MPTVEKYAIEYEIIRENIKYYRKMINLTQEALAEKADISISYMKQIESGKEYKNITLTCLINLAYALKVPLRALLDPNEKK